MPEIADSKYPVTHSRQGGVPKSDIGKRLIIHRIDFQQGEIRLIVFALKHCRKRATIVENHGDFAGIFDYMPISDNESLWSDKKS